MQQMILNELRRSSRLLEATSGQYLFELNTTKSSQSLVSRLLCYIFVETLFNIIWRCD